MRRGDFSRKFKIQDHPEETTIIGRSYNNKKDAAVARDAAQAGRESEE